VQWPSRKQSSVTKVHAQANKVFVVNFLQDCLSAEESSNSIPPADSKPEGRIPDSATVAECMAQVADLVKLVDKRDIAELKLKQMDFELIIRKKQVLPPAAPFTMMQSPYPQAMAPPPQMMQTPYPQAMPPQPAAAPSAPAAASASSVPALPPPAAKPASSHHQLKCPMAGTFYRSPAPGEPAFVKVGDKVQKGQVLCIIEAMKLMNEIEADQSGTITEILVDDGKPVSVDLVITHPLFFFLGRIARLRSDSKASCWSNYVCSLCLRLLHKQHRKELPAWPAVDMRGSHRRPRIRKAKKKEHYLV
ncbi:unnamed protein product, partial [Linum tenue]